MSCEAVTVAAVAVFFCKLFEMQRKAASALTLRGIFFLGRGQPLIFHACIIYTVFNSKTRFCDKM